MKWKENEESTGTVKGAPTMQRKIITMSFIRSYVLEAMLTVDFVVSVGGRVVDVVVVGR